MTETPAQRAERRAHEALDAMWGQQRSDPTKPETYLDAHAALDRALDEREKEAREECLKLACYRCASGDIPTMNMEPDGYRWWVHSDTERCNGEAIRRRVDGRKK